MRKSDGGPVPFIPFGLDSVELKASGEGIVANVARPKVCICGA